MKVNSIKEILLALPAYIWVVVFLLLPCLIVIAISVSHYSTDIPPFKLLILENKNNDPTLSALPTLDNFILLLKEPLYIKAFFSSVRLALISSAICLLIGYPIALCIAEANNETKILLLMLVFLPFWTSLVIRVYAWKTILGDYGILNNFLIHIGWIEQPIQFLNSNSAVIVGIVYCYLPFMVLPLFVSIEKIDKSLIEASLDLGCSPFQAFLKVIIPLSLPGIIVGSILVFIPAIGEYVIPDLLKHNGLLTLGKVIWNEFFMNIDWPIAAAITVSVMTLFIAPLMWLQKTLTETNE